MNKQHELTDEQWQVVESILFKHATKTGLKPKDLRQMLNGIVASLCGALPSQDVSERCDAHWAGHEWPGAVTSMVEST